MNKTAEAFLASFDSKNLITTKKNLEDELSSIEVKLNNIAGIVTVLSGLKHTEEQERIPEHYDPGKYDVAFYFLKNNYGNRITVYKSFEDYKRTSCPACKRSDLPLLVRYSQTEDSPDGDTWEADIFTICPDCFGIYRLEELDAERRFLFRT